MFRVTAYSDELLFSWIERIGLFYGVDYLRARMMLNPTRLSNVWGENEDVDSSDEIRRLLISLTGYREHVVPSLLPTTSSGILDVSARVAYCPACWHEDVEHGRAPYIRSQWSSRTNVMCTKHETWLSARLPGIQFGSELNGWAPIWQTDSNWASAAHLGHDLAMRPFASGFEAKTIGPPTCGWNRADAEFHVIALDHVVLQLVSRPESSNVRAHVRDAIEVARNARVTDFDLRGYRSGQPGWIVDRKRSAG
jgi:TniQ